VVRVELIARWVSSLMLMSIEASVLAADESRDAVELIDRELAVLALSGADQAMLREQIVEGVKRVADRLAERLPELAES
jgi:hypothetical protein